MNTKYIEEAVENIQLACHEYEKHGGSISKNECEEIIGLFKNAIEFSQVLKPGQERYFTMGTIYKHLENIPTCFCRRYCRTEEPVRILKDEYNSTLLISLCISDYKMREEWAYLRFTKYGKKIFIEFTINNGDVVFVKAQGGEVRFSIM